MVQSTGVLGNRQHIDENTVVSVVTNHVLRKQDNLNGHVKLNMDIIFGSVLMVCSKIGHIFPTSVEDTYHQSFHVFFEAQCVCKRNRLHGYYK